MSFSPEYNSFKAYILTTVIMLWTALSLLTYGLLLLVPFMNQRLFIPIYHRVMCFLMGIEIIQKGQISTIPSTLFVSNHVSYMDIPVLGSLINASFVAKSEIASWPLISSLAKIQNTIFIERKPSKTKSQIQILREHLNSGISLILFPEGTSTNGAQVLPLKSSLFSAAESEQAGVSIQTVSIVYAQHNGEGMDQTVRDRFAWYANFPFGSHFFKMLGMGKVTVIVTYNEPVKMSDFSSRKECASACEALMRDSFNESFIESGSSV